MNNVCPSCGTAYNVSPRDVGRRIACKTCRSALVVTKNGLEPDDQGTDIEGSSGLEDRPLSRAKSSRGFFPQIDFSTWLFGFGAFFTILFLFFPLIDQARVASRTSDIEAGELQLSEELEIEKDGVRKKKLEEDWGKEKKRYERRVTWSKISLAQANWWNRNGMMVGFLLLAFGSLGFLSPKHPPMKRVVGAVILIALLVLIFMVFAIAGGSAGALR